MRPARSFVRCRSGSRGRRIRNVYLVCAVKPGQPAIAVGTHPVSPDPGSETHRRRRVSEVRKPSRSGGAGALTLFPFIIALDAGFSVPPFPGSIDVDGIRGLFLERARGAALP